MKRHIMLAALLALSVRAEAQEKQDMAFAAAIAPEAAFEVCHKPDAIAAAQCAMAACVKAAGEGAECMITSACGRGWAGAMGVTTGEVHWTETVCGAPDEASVIAALKQFCTAQKRYVQQCFLSSVWTPEGKAIAKEEMWEAKELK